MSEELTEQNPLTVVQNIEGTWDILVNGNLTHPRLTQWTAAGAEEIVAIIHGAYLAKLNEMRAALEEGAAALESALITFVYDPDRGIPRDSAFYKPLAHMRNALAQHHGTEGEKQ